MAEDTEVKRGLIRDTIYYALGYFTQFFYGLLMTPIIVYYAGREVYAITILGVILANWLGLLDFKIVAAATQRCGEERARQNFEAISAILSGCIFYFLGLLVFVCFPMTLFADMLAALLGIEEYREAVDIIRIYLVLLPISRILSAFYGVLRGLQKGHIVVKISFISNIPILAGSWFILAMGWGIVCMLCYTLLCAILQVVTYIIVLGYHKIYIKRLHPAVIKQISSMLSFGFNLFVCEIITLIYYSDRIIIKLITGALGKVAFYQFGFSIIRQVGEMAILPISSLVPAASYLWGKQDREGLQSLLYRGTQVLCLFGFPLLFFTILFAEEFLIAWLALPLEEAKESATYLRILAIAHIINLPSGVASSMGMSMGNPQLQLKATLITFAFVVVAFFTFLRELGVTGVACAVSGAGCMLGILYVVMFGMFFPFNVQIFLRGCVFVPLFSAATTLIPIVAVKLFALRIGLSDQRWEALGVIAIGFTLYLLIYLMILIRIGLFKWGQIRSSFLQLFR
jgi:O-antigen/teichoic acid export membrane protein